MCMLNAQNSAEWIKGAVKHLAIVRYTISRVLRLKDISLPHDIAIMRANVE